MKLRKDIPQFLPMHGRKIRIYFKNMNKLCTNCYGSHSRRQCTNERVPWVTYVRDFMKNNPEINEHYYGKWWDIVDQEFPGYFDQPNETQDVQQFQDAPRPTTQGSTQARIERPTRQAPEADELPLRVSRDPRVRRHQDGEDELGALMNKGLSLDEAKNYIKNKKEQDQLEQRMRNMSTTMRSRADERIVERATVTKTGPGSSRGGRGGLAFN